MTSPARRPRPARSHPARACASCPRTSPRCSPPATTEIGWLAQAGRVPLGYLGDADKTARTFPVIDGVRYSVPGDRARLTGRRHASSCTAATRSPSTPAARRSSPRRSSRARCAIPPSYDCVVAGRPSRAVGQRGGRDRAAAPTASRRPTRTSSRRRRGTSPATSCRRRSCGGDADPALAVGQGRLPLGHGASR